MAHDITTTDAYVTSRRQPKKFEMLFARRKRILRLDRPLFARRKRILRLDRPA